MKSPVEFASHQVTIRAGQKLTAGFLAANVHGFNGRARVRVGLDRHGVLVGVPVVGVVTTPNMLRKDFTG